ncbi:FkbM family methyltransferase [Hyphobacterium marinum]|uniref:FkbM family methyltransferase n=1 Tax=Hyphobacterium marinum TaxID=3116574 RepID=A0ABU7LZV0_9PROT|nr:FkbM family methyltransferase [Hyphobacterium sp. Y6023]MEE2567089.1 FkbM family methyltransferase [Hyphobacterium sp. Y6023]
MTDATISDEAPAWGALAPSGLFAALLGPARSSRSGALARLAMAFAPDAADIETLGFRARLHPKDNLSEKRALVSPQRFDPAELAWLSDHLTGDFSFIDLGANCGIYTLHLAVKAGPGARFVAVDPQPEMLRRLRFNLAANDLTERVRVMDVAVSDEAGELTFHVNTNNRGESGLITEGETITVKALTLLDLLDETGLERPGAIKIDVEGMEMRILARFFDEAPEGRWPGALVLESLYSNETRDPVALARTKGYAVALDTGRNVILTR